MVKHKIQSLVTHWNTNYTALSTVQVRYLILKPYITRFVEIVGIADHNGLFLSFYEFNTFWRQVYVLMVAGYDNFNSPET